jgi:hypothetical protein
VKKNTPAADSSKLPNHTRINLDNWDDILPSPALNAQFLEIMNCDRLPHILPIRFAVIYQHLNISTRKMVIRKSTIEPRINAACALRKVFTI